MSLAIKGGAIIQYPLVETNANRKPRSIVWKRRNLKGPIGAAIRGSYGVLRLFPKASESVDRYIPKTECMHWGLQIGPYLYELVTDEGSNGHLIWRRIYQLQPEFWRSDAADRIIGSTCETDKQISEIAQYVRDLMCSGDPAFSSKGRYSLLNANCQEYLGYLFEALISRGGADLRATDAGPHEFFTCAPRGFTAGTSDAAPPPAYTDVGPPSSTSAPVSHRVPLPCGHAPAWYYSSEAPKEKTLPSYRY